MADVPGSRVLEGGKEGSLEQIYIFYMECPFAKKSLYPAFPDWIPTPWTVRTQDWHLDTSAPHTFQFKSPFRSNNYYKAIFCCYCNTSSQTLRNKTEKGLDWSRDRGHIFPSQTSCTSGRV